MRQQRIDSEDHIPAATAAGSVEPMRRNELVGGGHFVFARGSRTGRIKTGAIMAGKIPFEHPTLESAVAEAMRLSELYGRRFYILSQIVAVEQVPAQ